MRGAAAGGACEASPLAEVSSCVEVGHSSSMIGHGTALFVSDDQIAMFLVKVGDKEVHEHAADGIGIEIALVVADPTVAKGLHGQADAVHLAVGSNGTSVGKCSAILSAQVGDQLEVFLRMRAQ